MNDTIKNCRTCAHCQPKVENSHYDRCMRFRYYCDIAYQSQVDCKRGEAWQQAPPLPPPVPRRSLRQWLYDTFWK